ncbi:unnamed protein product [Larinioides sclopetarius]|uniref:Cyclic nucleotide-binding domain-containing protein n=1 Tax=Larinioides sclopetarius TaxID=280406 RepID=A0AAV2A4I6_9ARAC
MMVDGSHGTIPPPPHQDIRTQQQALQPIKSPITTTASTSEAPKPAEETSVTTSGRSRWEKLRNTVQISSAITQAAKKPPLKREDSFLKRFSTRPVPDQNSAEGSSRLAGEGIMKSQILGVWRSVVNPDENILFYWLSLLTVCLLYNAWTIIVRQAFPELQQGWSTMWYCLDAFSDAVFILDIAFQFRTGYLEQGLMVCESRKLACHYIKSKSFILDIAAIIPLDLVQLYFGAIPILRFPRFLKLYRSFRLYYMVESRTIYPNLWRVVNLIHILLLLAHWFGCFYYLLSELEDFIGEWSYHKPIDDYATLSRKYLGSVYWSTLTLTTIGDLATPATNLQYMFTIISYLIGVFIFATIVGQVGTVITNRNASRLEFERLLDGAKLYMRHHKVPRNMQRRVQRWYDYSWSRGRMQGGGDINSALGILPDKLKTELALHVNLKTLKKVSIFQECQPEFLHDLVLKMRAYIFTPGDLICRKGEVAREMFIIADGILEVISETGKVLTQMKAGDFFGEIGILNLDGFNRRTADVRSVGYSELFSLSREDILAAMKDYPEAQDILQTMGRKRLMEARLAANIGRTGNPNESNIPTSTQGSTDREKTESAKPRSTVSKLKEDVRSLKNLLRTRSTTTKIQFKREDSTTSVKTFTERLSSFRKTEKTYVESSSVSTDDSADSSTPLNKSLPLLQRVRLLGAQEKKSEILGSTIQTSKTKIELLQSAEQGKDIGKKGSPSPKSEHELTVKPELQPPSPKSKTNPFSVLTSVIPKGSTSPKKSPKKEVSPDGKKSPVSFKNRLQEPSSELPLLKKVLLRKVMDDKKAEDSQTENQQGTSSDQQPLPSENNKNDNGDVSQETVSNRVYLEQFSRTLGFKMSEDVVPPTKAQPRQRLNASSLTPSPSSENVISSCSEQNQKEEEKEENKAAKSTSPPKGRLSRMMAVREDSDENSVLAEDPFVKSTECQTEIIGSVLERSNVEEASTNESESDIALRNYLTKMVTDLQAVIKAYSLEQQQDLLKENKILKQNQNNKNDVIKKLMSRIEETQPWESFEEVSSLGASSISVSELKEGHHSLRKEPEPLEDYEIPQDEEERDPEDEEVLALKDRLRFQRKSWPTQVSIRRKLEPKSMSLDDESQDPTVEEQEEMWRLEFPPPPPDMEEAPWMGVSKPIYPVVSESLIDTVNPPEEDLPQLNKDAEKSANDWEVQMLVQQFEENVLLQRGASSRRHSSGEALTWDKALHMRNTIRTKNQTSDIGDRRSGRKYSLIEESSSRTIGAVSQWAEAGISPSLPHSTSYTSLINLENRQGTLITEKSDKTDSVTFSQKNVALITQFPPKVRKGSLPIISAASTICKTRCMSLEDVKNNETRECNHQTSISSSCSQETVVEMETKSPAVVDAHNYDKLKLSTRSPSSPNVSTDKEPHMSIDFSRLSDWPSSPCLPTIREDDQMSGSANTPLKSSPGRSVSHDCLPKKGSLPIGKQSYKTTSRPPCNPDSFHSLETICNASGQAGKRDSVVLSLDPRSHHYQEMAPDNQYYSNIRAANISSRQTLGSGMPVKDNSRSISQSNVVVSIPECDPVLSP